MFSTSYGKQLLHTNKVVAILSLFAFRYVRLGSVFGHKSVRVSEWFFNKLCTLLLFGFIVHLVAVRIYHFIVVANWFTSVNSNMNPR